MSGFNIDSDLIDGQTPMGKFMRISFTEPNVAKIPSFLSGSAKFKKLVDSYAWDEAMEVCLARVNQKVDSISIEGQTAMGKFMRMFATEPKVARRHFIRNALVDERVDILDLIRFRFD